MTDSAEQSAPCLLCSSPSTPRFEKSGCAIFECGACGHQFCKIADRQRHVSAVYDDGYFQSGGAGYADYLSESNLLRNRGKKYGALLSKHLKPGRLLDVGAAAGLIAQGLRDAGWSPTGIEPNATMAKAARTNGVSVWTGAFEDYSDPEPYDAITLIQVIAHFVDPVSVVRKVEQLVRPGGVCLVETWDRASLSARFFGQNWHEYSPPSVLQWFSKQSLRELFERHRFRRLRNGRLMKWLSAGHAQSLLHHALGSGGFATLATLPSRILPTDLPLPYPSEDLFWMVFERLD